MSLYVAELSGRGAENVGHENVGYEIVGYEIIKYFSSIVMLHK